MTLTKKSALYGIVVSLLLASGAWMAWAGGHDHGSSGHGHGNHGQGNHSHGHHDASHHDTAHAHHHAMAAFIQQLNLTTDQQAKMAELHELMSGLGSGAMAAHHSQLRSLVQRIDHEGGLSQVDVRVMIDQHIDQLRHRAYEIGDRIVELIDSLDDEQRATLHEHLSQLRSADGDAGKAHH